MIESIELGATPSGEECAQVGDSNYSEMVVKECRAYKKQLERILISNGFEDYRDHIVLMRKGFPHDFGTYYEVVVSFDDFDTRAVQIAFWLEANTPENWDKEAIEELGVDSSVIKELSERANSLGYKLVKI